MHHTGLSGNCFFCMKLRYYSVNYVGYIQDYFVMSQVFLRTALGALNGGILIDVALMLMRAGGLNT